MSDADIQAVTLRPFEGSRPDGGVYSAFERVSSDKFPAAVTVFLFSPPLDHDAQPQMVYSAVRDSYGLDSSDMDAGTSPMRVEARSIGNAMVVDDERYTYSVFSVKASAEDKRWGALTVWRQPRQR